MLTKNKTYYLVCSAVVFLCMILASCTSKKNEDKQQVIIEPKEDSTISQEQAISIFKDLAGKEPIYCIVSNTICYKEACIVCLANKTGTVQENQIGYCDSDIVFYKLTKFANAWRIDTERDIFAAEDGICSYFYKDFEIELFNGKPYLYFLYKLSPKDDELNCVELRFALYSLYYSEFTTLDYVGKPKYDQKHNLQHIKGDFTNLDEFTNESDL